MDANEMLLCFLNQAWTRTKSKYDGTTTMVRSFMTADLSTVGMIFSVNWVNRTSGSAKGEDDSNRVNVWFYPATEMSALNEELQERADETNLSNTSSDLVQLSVVPSLGPHLALHVDERLVEQAAHLRRLVRREQDCLSEELRLAVEVPGLDAGEITAMSVRGENVELREDELGEEKRRQQANQFGSRRTRRPWNKGEI